MKDQVAYYVEQWQLDDVAAEISGIQGFANTTTTGFAYPQYKKKRKIPAMSASNADTWQMHLLNIAQQCNSASVTFSNIGQYGCKMTGFTITSGSHTAGDGIAFTRDGTNVCYLLIDARH